MAKVENLIECKYTKEIWWTYQRGMQVHQKGKTVEHGMQGGRSKYIVKGVS